ncbi:MAG: hypothetical protein KAR20_17925, partial [Candidatus Heimdallarchaeota archaeon]|nr:hypothetical protein [Candidatus Heimdallarchaeota archaeon]
HHIHILDIYFILNMKGEFHTTSKTNIKTETKVGLIQDAYDLVEHFEIHLINDLQRGFFFKMIIV